MGTDVMAATRMNKSSTKVALCILVESGYVSTSRPAKTAGRGSEIRYTIDRAAFTHDLARFVARVIH